MPRLATTLALAALGACVLTPAAIAQEATLGGGSDLSDGAVVALTQGASVPAVHHLFADNREAAPIAVEFRSAAPATIEVVAEADRFDIPPGGSVRAPFTIRVSPLAPPGDHRVTVQLVRSDIEPRPGAVTNVPAVGVTFTVRVHGEAATAVLRAVGAESGRPVDGTLTLAALHGGAAVEVARGDGSELRATVAPGSYEAAYLLDGRELARERLDLAAGETGEVLLRVDTVAFALVAAKPVVDDGRVVLADLVAAVDNRLRALEGPVRVRAEVWRDGAPVDDVVLADLDGLPLGVTEAAASYRPGGGFRPGTYRFRFELVTAEFTAGAAEQAGFDVPSPFALWRATGVVAAALALASALWLLRLRRLRRRCRHRAPTRLRPAPPRAARHRAPRSWSAPARP